MNPKIVSRPSSSPGVQPLDPPLNPPLNPPLDPPLDPPPGPTVGLTPGPTPRPIHGPTPGPTHPWTHPETHPWTHLWTHLWTHPWTNPIPGSSPPRTRPTPHNHSWNRTAIGVAQGNVSLTREQRLSATRYPPPPYDALQENLYLTTRCQWSHSDRHTAAVCEQDSCTLGTSHAELCTCGAL